MFKRILLLIILVFSIGAEARADNTGTLAESSEQTLSVGLPSIAVTSLHQWVLQRMITWLPPGRSFIKNAIETPEEGKARYEKIADAAISVVYDPNEKPIFGGKYGRAKTLALILSVAYFESGYRKDVDLNLGPSARGDKGKSWCMMQVMLGRPWIDGNTRKRVVIGDDPYYRMFSRPVKYINGQVQFTSDPVEGWGGVELVSDRQKCFRTGLHLIRKSFHSCRSIPVEDRLSVYGAGKCISDMQASRIRVKKAQKWLAHDKPPLLDEEVIKLLHPSGDDSDNTLPVNVGPISKWFNTRPSQKAFVSFSI